MTPPKAPHFRLFKEHFALSLYLTVILLDTNTVTYQMTNTSIILKKRSVISFASLLSFSVYIPCRPFSRDVTDRRGEKKQPRFISAGVCVRDVFIQRYAVGNSGKR